MNPLKLFKSKEVYILLKDFFKINFEIARVGREIGEKIVDLTWENKDRISEPELKNLINSLFEQAKKETKTNKFKPFEIDPIALFDFSETKSLLDYGANKLHLINRMGFLYPEIENFYAVDIVPQVIPFSFPERSTYIEVDTKGEVFPIKDNTIDVINTQFVLHHLENEQVLNKILQNFYKALKPNGRLIIWEESFEKQIDLSNLIEEARVKGFATDKDLTERFYNLSEEKKWEFIIVNDWIINANVPHIPWTGLYYKWEEWINILNTNGFKLIQNYNLGLRASGQLKKGVHIIGEFKKIS